MELSKQETDLVIQFNNAFDEAPYLLHNGLFEGLTLDAYFLYPNRTQVCITPSESVRESDIVIASGAFPVGKRIEAKERHSDGIGSDHVRPCDQGVDTGNSRFASASGPVFHDVSTVYDVKGDLGLKCTAKTRQALGQLLQAVAVEDLWMQHDAHEVLD